MSFDPWQTSSGAYGHHAVLDAQEKRYKVIKRQCDDDAKLAAQLQAEEWQYVDKLLSGVERTPGDTSARAPGADMPSMQEVLLPHPITQ